MKNNPLIGEGLISLLLIVLVALFLNPLQKLWMPTMGATTMVLAVIIIFIIFISFFWKEQAHDEREAVHRLVAGRFGFIFGAAILLLAIIAQTLQHRLDDWLVVALVGMVIGKIIGNAYSQLKQ